MVVKKKAGKKKTGKKKAGKKKAGKKKPATARSGARKSSRAPLHSDSVRADAMAFAARLMS